MAYILELLAPTLGFCALPTTDTGLVQKNVVERGAGGGRSRLLRQAALLAREVAHCRVRPEGSVAARYMPKPLRGIDIPARDAPSGQVAIVGVVVYDHCPTSEPQSGHDLRAVVKIQVRRHIYLVIDEAEVMVREAMALELRRRRGDNMRVRGGVSESSPPPRRIVTPHPHIG